MPQEGSKGVKFAVFVALLAAAFYGWTLTESSRTVPLGNLLRKPSFRVEDIPSLKGKTALVTGANSGTGKESVFWLAKAGCHVIATCRSARVCDDAIKDMRARAGLIELNIEVEILDLSSLASVKALAAKLANRELHILLLNAGVMASPYMLTADGIEQQWGVNHVAHQYLTTLLLPNLEKSAPSRIVSVASSAHTMSPDIPEKLTLDFFNNEATYHQFGQYGLSKLSNILMVNKLARLLADKKIYANVIHPGFVDTGLLRHIETTQFFTQLSSIAKSFIAYDVTQGTVTQLYAATSPEIEERDLRNQYFIPIAVIGTPTAQGRNDSIADRLWDFTEELIRTKTAHLQ